MWLQQNMNSQNSQIELHNISFFCLGWLLPSPFPLYRNTWDSWVIPLSWPKSKQTHVIVSVRNHHSKTHVIACVRKHRLRIGFNFAPGIPIWCNFVASVIHVDFECTWLVLVSLLVRNVTLLCRSFSSRSHASQKSVAGLSQTRPNLDGARNGWIYSQDVRCNLLRQKALLWVALM